MITSSVRAHGPSMDTDAMPIVAPMSGPELMLKKLPALGQDRFVAPVVVVDIRRVVLGLLEAVEWTALAGVYVWFHIVPRDALNERIMARPACCKPV